MLIVIIYILMKQIIKKTFIIDLCYFVSTDYLNGKIFVPSFIVSAILSKYGYHMTGVHLFLIEQTQFRDIDVAGTTAYFPRPPFSRVDVLV